MDQSIHTTLNQCAALQKQVGFAHRLVVPFSVEYHFEARDTREPAFMDTLDITAQGQLSYEPVRAMRVNLPKAGGTIGREVLIPDSLAATVPGQASVQGPGAGGDFGVSAVEIMISGPLPGISASVTFQCREITVANIQFDVDPNTPPPIRLVANDARGNTTVVLHLGPAAIVFGLPAGPHEVGPVLG